MNRLLSIPVLVILITLTATSCTNVPEIQPMVVSLVVDGQERAYPKTDPITIDQFLREAEVELGPLDRVNPPLVTQISDGMRVEVVRVQVEEQCEEVEIPYREITTLYEGLQPGEQREQQAGRNGVEQVCYRVEIANGQPGDRAAVRRSIVSNPQDRIIFVGPTTELEPVPINGTLAYISNRNVWILRGSSTNRRPLTSTGDLDQAVFSLTADGRQLLFSRTRDASLNAFNNQLWLIADTTLDSPTPLPLTPQDVLYAEWVPERSNTFSYSRAESSQAAPGWRALNDLWITRIDPFTGTEIDIEQVLPESGGGLLGWWGMEYFWAPDGQRLAWVQSNSVGLVDFENGTLNTPLIEFPLLNPLSDWSWRTTVSWAPDSSLIATTVHGPPVGSESPETSPVFNITVVAADGTFTANMLDSAGIWSTPRYSPELRSVEGDFPRGYIAYLRAREPYESINGEYDLIVADRDGSNARVIFPPEDQPGLTAQQYAQDFTWSPDGRQIALIYRGNLWVVDVQTRISHQLTLDGGASKPLWTQ
jgi:resuscitation-promoting factor RpfB